ncbi:hypothetical protein C2G38_819159 [Gigaspora rosea]|uniref:NYN domain-containing protein n=1 Tax=Gigaspora rosea TaxID=44941 RepID=A0A397TYP9_9GLOM|nr:hypothetical protein C2G38_819159 [Gigaspora rosea]
MIFSFFCQKSIKTAPFISTFYNVVPAQRFTLLKASQLVYSTKAIGEKRENVKEKEESKVSKTEGNTSLYQNPPLVNTGLIYVFVDNSNVFIEGKYAIAELEKLGTFDNKRRAPCFNQFRIDHGKLLTTIQGNRKLGDAPVIVGSRPPPNDSLWRSVREQGYDAMVYDRNIENREKKVDVALAHTMSKVILTKSPGILALVSGDNDFEPIVTIARKSNWIVETWFWKMGMSGELSAKTISHLWTITISPFRVVLVLTSERAIGFLKLLVVLFGIGETKK